MKRQIVKLDVLSNSSLVVLRCDDNKLMELNVSKNINISWLSFAIIMIAMYVLQETQMFFEMLSSIVFL